MNWIKKLNTMLTSIFRKYKDSIINLWLLTFALAICIGIIEFGSYLLYDKVAPEKGRKVIDALVFGNQSIKTGEFSDGTAVSEIEILPYYLYRNKPFSKINNIQQINSEGYRNGNKEFGKKEKDKIRIIAIGGSTTFGWLIKNWQQTWPSQLEEILNKQFNGKVEVVNAGLPAGMSSESLVAFILKDKYLEPDIVIFHNGGNDLAPLLHDKYYPDYRYNRAILGSDKLRPGEHSFITGSHFVKLFYAFWMQDATLSSIRGLNGIPEKKVGLKEALKNVEKNNPVGFERNMNTLIQEIKDIRAEVVIFPFHLASDKIYKIIPESMRSSQELHLAIYKGVQKNKTVLKSLAHKYKVLYHEMEQDRIPLKYFFDHCHLKPEGDKMKAEFISQYVAPLVAKRIKENNTLL